jgi:hypothetical protein
MAATMDKLNTFTSTGAQTSVTFSAIPATYTDLYIKASLQEVGTTNDFEQGWIVFNGDNSGTSYARTWQYFNIGSPYLAFAATGNSVGYGLFAPTTKNTYGTAPYRVSNTDIYISNYASDFNPKSANIVGGSNDNWTTIFQGTNVGGISWSSASAITSVSLYSSGLSWGAGSTIDLYGIKNT